MDLRSLEYFVAVVEEHGFRRAAARLHMTQPPLSRAIRQLESELGTVLIHRLSAGVSPTPAGEALYDEALVLLEHAEQLRMRVTAVAGTATVTIGVLGESTGQTGMLLVKAFRARHPGVQVRIREADLSDPTTGLRAGLVDVALTRAPFDQTGISTRILRADAVGVVLRNDDPLARRATLSLRDLADHRRFRLPAGTDPVWRAYWSGLAPTDDEDPHSQVVRTSQECMQAVLWNGSVGLSPIGHTMADGLVWIPLTDMPPSHLVAAWRKDDPNPLIHSFVKIATRTIATPPTARASTAVR